MEEGEESDIFFGEEKLANCVKGKTAYEEHLKNTIQLLYFTLILISVVLTFLGLKRRKITFIHESGLALLYGILVGCVFKFASNDSNASTLQTTRDVQLAETHDHLPMDSSHYLRINASCDNKTQQFRYILMESHADAQESSFDYEIFVGVILPPIIFNAGYSLKKRHFFRNFGTILTFAIIGTSLSFIVTSLIMFGLCIAIGVQFSLKDVLLFGSMISPTDPVIVASVFNELNVDSDLFAVLFGEGSFNNAVVIVLSNTIEQQFSTLTIQSFSISAIEIARSVGIFFGVLIGSMSLGVIVGCLSAVMTKFTRISQYPLLETSFFLMASYSSFLLAEVCRMTGIVSVLFCGICQSHYTYSNLSLESRKRTKDFFDVTNFVFETLVFAYIAVSLFTSSISSFNAWFIFGSLAATLVSRALFIYFLSAIVNVIRSPKIPYNFQHMFVFSGMRGAVAFALSIRNTSTINRQIMYTTTSIVIIVNVIMNGGLTAWTIKLLGLKSNVDQETEMQSDLLDRPILDDTFDTEGLNLSGNYQKSALARNWCKIDDKILKPLFTHAYPPLIQTMPRCCWYLAKFLTSSKQIKELERRQTAQTIDEDILGIGNIPDINEDFGPLRLISA